MVVAGMIQLHTLYPAVKRRKNDMTGQAPLRRPPCFMTGSLTFAVVKSVGATARRGAGAKQRAATTQTPRRPIGAGGVRGASRSGSASVITTHDLFARKVQRKP